MPLFGKKKEEAAPAAPPTGVPTDRVIAMRQQGLSNNQIIQTLQREGYSSSQIFDAMSQADIKGIVAPAPPAAPEAAPPEAAPAEMPPPEEIPPMPPPEEMPPPPEAAVPPAAMPAAAPGVGREEIEEVAESIVSEKWDELMKSVDKIIAWKDATEAKITKLEQQITDLKTRFEELHKGILAKIGEYDQGIRAVGTEIKAMESVFKKILPTFTENVGELSRITKALRAKKKTK